MDDAKSAVVEERTPNGELLARYQVQDGVVRRLDVQGIRRPIAQRLLDVFLPAGYPKSVTDDYTWYQIYDSLQAFCSSIAGLIASRAVLQGFGVGDASASANLALILKIAQEIVSRLTTILFAHKLGTTLSPECKRYRLMADIFNDAALVLDVLSPLPIFMKYRALHAGILCLSGALLALCGTAAGASKAALSVHFAKEGEGDIGDLNAKDSSQETVVGLVGMLVGSWLVPKLKSTLEIYVALGFLVIGHLGLNLMAVKSVALGTLNRQRASIVFSEAIYQGSGGKTRVLDPRMTSRRERILISPSLLRHPRTGKTLGQIRLGISVVRALELEGRKGKEVKLTDSDSYRLYETISGTERTVEICLKSTAKTVDVQKAWYLATFILLKGCKATTWLHLHQEFHLVMGGLRSAGWETERDLFVKESESRWVDPPLPPLPDFRTFGSKKVL